MPANNLLHNSLLPFIGKTEKKVTFYITDIFHCEGLELTKEQFLVLKFLHDKDGRIQNDLAFITNRSKTSLTRLLHTMEKKGLVLRTISKNDKRANNVFLTEQGKRIFETSMPILKIIIDDLESGISKKDIETTKKVLMKIQGNIKNKTTINQ